MPLGQGLLSATTASRSSGAEQGREANAGVRRLSPEESEALRKRETVEVLGRIREVGGYRVSRQQVVAAPPGFMEGYVREWLYRELPPFDHIIKYESEGSPFDEVWWQAVKRDRIEVVV